MGSNWCWCPEKNPQINKTSGESRMLMRYIVPATLLLAMVFPACSSPPPDDLFTTEIRKMTALDRGLGFREEITSITVVDRIEHPEQYEIQIRVEGWATHPDLTIGATLPAATSKRESWAMWTFFCREKEDETWFVEEKFKVDEGFK
jgi:hypothetical protein